MPANIALIASYLDDARACQRAIDNTRARRERNTDLGKRAAGAALMSKYLEIARLKGWDCK
jgi:hypothetical protein